MAVDPVSSRAGVVIPVAPVNPSVEASPPLEPTPSVVNHVNPALHTMGPQKQPNEGETTYTSVPDPVSRGASAQQLPHDWTIHRPAPQKAEDPPPKPISKVLMDHLKTMWTASASAVQIEQVKNQVSTPQPISPAEVPGQLAKQALVYTPSKVKKTENL